MNTLKEQADKLLEASGFNTCFQEVSRPVRFTAFLETRQTEEPTVKSKVRYGTSYLEAVRVLEFYETEEGKALVAATKVLQTKRNQRTRNKKVAAERKAANVARKALRALKRS